MRQRFERQLDLGQIPIEEVPIPPKSRDELPPVLRGLQWIFQTPEVNEQMKTKNYSIVCVAVSLVVVLTILFVPGVSEAIETNLLTFLATNAR